MRGGLLVGRLVILLLALLASSADAFFTCGGARPRALSRARFLLASDVPPEAPGALTAVELKALDEVSQSLKQCGETVTKFGSKRSFYQSVYTPGEEKGTWIDPTPEDWDSIRAEWPELSGRSDASLAQALPELRLKQRDYRFLKKLDLNTMGPHSVRGR